MFTYATKPVGVNCSKIYKVMWFGGIAIVEKLWHRVHLLTVPNPTKRSPHLTRMTLLGKFEWVSVIKQQPSTYWNKLVRYRITHCKENLAPSRDRISLSSSTRTVGTKRVIRNGYISGLKHAMSECLLESGTNSKQVFNSLYTLFLVSVVLDFIFNVTKCTG